MLIKHHMLIKQLLHLFTFTITLPHIMTRHIHRLIIVTDIHHTIMVTLPHIKRRLFSRHLHPTIKNTPPHMELPLFSRHLHHTMMSILPPLIRQLSQHLLLRMGIMMKMVNLITLSTVITMVTKVSFIRQSHQLNRHLLRQHLRMV